MLSFKTFITEEAKNTHMEHMEDMIFNEGAPGARNAINFLRDLRDMLAGHSSAPKNITVKWDGAPAIFAGIDPGDGKFFVAKKGLFNVNPIMYKSLADIKNDKKLVGELRKKFTIAFNEFSKLGIKSGVFQGDLMFTKGDVQLEEIDGERFYTFQPNTIVYAVPINSPLGKFIKRAQIGVIWHTTYTGKDIRKMKAFFGRNIVGKFKKSNTIWMDDATYKDVSGNATFTEAETKRLTAILSNAGKVFRTVSGDMLRTISEDDELKVLIKTYNNTFVRAGEPFPNPKKHVTGLMEWLTNKFDKQIESKKTEAGKNVWREKKKRALRIFTDPKSLVNIFELMNQIVLAKAMIVDKLNKAGGLGTFLRTNKGFKITSPEGFVAIDNIKGTVKLVDRLEFSRANFSSDVIKGWER